MECPHQGLTFKIVIFYSSQYPHNKVRALTSYTITIPSYGWVHVFYLWPIRALKYIQLVNLWYLHMGGYKYFTYDLPWGLKYIQSIHLQYLHMDGCKYFIYDLPWGLKYIQLVNLQYLHMGGYKYFIYGLLWG
jgi:hypothetical protein